jgi:hypothetical protein
MEDGCGLFDTNCGAFRGFEALIFQLEGLNNWPQGRIILRRGRIILPTSFRISIVCKNRILLDGHSETRRLPNRF